jgi:hypothetical protein
MTIIVQLRLEADAAAAPIGSAVAHLPRQQLTPEPIGVPLAEGTEGLAHIQTARVPQPVAAYTGRQRACPYWGARQVSNWPSILVRPTRFGTLPIPSPRCARGACQVAERHSCRRRADRLPKRTTPELR